MRTLTRTNLALKAFTLSPDNIPNGCFHGTNSSILYSSINSSILYSSETGSKIVCNSDFNELVSKEKKSMNQQMERTSTRPISASMYPRSLIALLLTLILHDGKGVRVEIAIAAVHYGSELKKLYHSPFSCNIWAVTHTTVSPYV